MPSPLDLSVVVPIYNEAESIEPLVQAIADAVISDKSTATK